MFDQRQRQFLELGGCSVADVQALETQTISEAQRERIVHAKELIMAQDKGVIEALEHIILDSKFANLHNEHILGWLPPVVLDEVIAWLEAEAESDEDDEDDEA